MVWMRVTDEDINRLAGLHLAADQIQDQGNMAYQPAPAPGELPRLDGRLQVGEVYLREYLRAARDTSGEAKEKPKSSKNEKSPRREKCFRPTRSRLTCCGQ
jgi:hypothetical protein